MLLGLLYSVPLIVDPCLHQRLLDTHGQAWLSLLWDHCSFLLGPGVCKVLLCPPRVYFPSPVEVCNQIPLPFKVKFPVDSQSLCWIPRLGSLLRALELLQQCKNFGKTVLQFVGRLLGGSIVGLMATSSKRTDATHHAQVCCSQNTCPPGRPQLTRASTGDNQTDKCRPGSVSCGSHCFFPSVLVHTRCCLCPSKVSVGL